MREAPQKFGLVKDVRIGLGTVAPLLFGNVLYSLPDLTHGILQESARSGPVQVG